MMAGTKRKASDQPTKSAEDKQIKQDGQKAVSKDISIPIDEGFCLESLPSKAPKVYIDEDGIIFDAALNQTNIENNNNKVRL